MSYDDLLPWQRNLAKREVAKWIYTHKDEMIMSEPRVDSVTALEQIMQFAQQRAKDYGIANDILDRAVDELLG